MQPIYKRYLITSTLLWCCSFVVLLAIYICLLIPQKERIKIVSSELARKEREYRRCKNIDNEESRLRMRDQVEDLNNRLANYVIDFDDLDNLTFSISKIARKVHAVSFKSIGKGADLYTPIEGCEYIGRIDTEIDFTTSFNKFTEFINFLERNNPVIFIDKISVSPINTSDVGHKVSVTLNVFVKLSELGVSDSFMKSI